MPVTLVDDLGHPVAVDPDAPPARIVSLVPSLSETLVSWGLHDRIVGVTEWCIAPVDAFGGAARVRGTKNPDIAAIVELEPDLVVANEEENRRVDVERLRAAGVPVWVTAPRSLIEVAGCFDRLGPVVGAAGAAAALASAIRSACGRADAARADRGRGLRTFCPVWRDPWIAVGIDTIAADLLHHAGLDVLPRESRYPRVELAEIAALEPEVVLLPDEPYEFGSADAEVFADWPASVHLVDGMALTWWGPRTPAALDAFAAIASA